MATLDRLLLEEASTVEPKVNDARLMSKSLVNSWIKSLYSQIYFIKSATFLKESARYVSMRSKVREATPSAEVASRAAAKVDKMCAQEGI